MEIPSECIQAQKDIDEIEQGFSNPNSIYHKTILNKGELLRLLASSYELLSINNVIDVPVNHIANHIMKRVTELNTNLSKAWIYDSLPTKYKSHRFNPNIVSEETESSKRTDNSSLYVNYEEQNSSEIFFYETQIQMCKKILTHLKTEPYIQKADENNITILDIQEYESDLVVRTAAQTLVNDTFDNRKTVPLNTIHLLLESFYSASNKYAAGLYISKLKEYGIQKKDQSINVLQKLFTPKQLGKILKGETREIHQSFQILTEEDAYENGFYGKAKCPECGDWRVRLEPKYNWTTDTFSDPRLRCYACLEYSDAPKVKLPLSRPTPQQQVVNTQP